MATLPMTTEQWRKIVDRASTLYERLSAPHERPAVNHADSLIHTRLQTWCQVVAKGDWEKFTRRLAWDGMDLTMVQNILGDTCIPYATLPGWVKLLQNGLEQSANQEPLTEGDRCLDADAPLPFEHVLLPFVQSARHQLIAASQTDYWQLSEPAHVALERDLLSRLSRLAAQPLFLEFSGFCATRITDSISSTAAPETTQRTLYADFVSHLFTGGLLTFFEEYSVLARLLATTIAFWVEANQEFLARLASDRTAIQTLFQPTTELGLVVMVAPGLSDRHSRGRTVITLTFATGCKLVYKPKDIGPEVAYFELLDWLNQRSGLLPLQGLKTLPRADYGWVEFAAHLPCEDLTAVHRYYYRMGMLLCLIYALGGTDCHRENLVAMGEHPVLVDMETVIYHRVQVVNATPESSPRYQENQQIRESVLQVGILPLWVIQPGSTYDVSALAGREGQPTPFRMLRWEQVNTDQMTFRTELGKTVACANLPFLPGVTLSLIDYEMDIVDGFQAFYHFLLQGRSRLLDSDSPLNRFAPLPTRFIFRPTRLYGYVLRALLQPKFMRHGVDRSIQQDTLSQALLATEERHPLWSLLQLEHVALAQLDVPLFTARADSHQLTLSQTDNLAAWFAESAMERAIARINYLSAADLTVQVQFIHQALAADHAVQTAVQSNGATTASKPLS